MEILKATYTSLDVRHEATIEDQNHCCLCGTQLKFQHKFDYMTLKVQEESSCPSCRISTRKREYTIQ
jgi:hypothetical protein